MLRIYTLEFVLICTQSVSREIKLSFFLQVRSTPIPTLQPSASWSDWTAWSAGNDGLDNIAPPAVDASLQGSGWTRPALFDMTVWSYQRFIADETLILVGGYSADPSRKGIRHVIGYLEGGLATSDTPIYDPTWGKWGYPFKVKQQGTKRGLARLVFDIVPWNGYINRTRYPVSTLAAPVYGWPIILDNPANPLTRTTKYLSPGGSGSDAGDGSVGNPWRTFKRAQSNATSDMLVICADGDTDETLSSATANPTLRAPIEFVQANGVNGTCRVSKNLNVAGGTLRTSHDSGLIRQYCNLLKYNRIKFDSSKFTTFTANGTSSPNSICIFEYIDFADSLSDQSAGSPRVGPVGGYWLSDKNDVYFSPSDGQRYEAVYSRFFSVNTAGISVFINCDITSAGDVQFVEMYCKNQSAVNIGSTVTLAPLFQGRLHQTYPETVVSTSSTGTGTSYPHADLKSCVIQLGGAVTVTNVAYVGNAALGNDYFIKFLTGPLAAMDPVGQGVGFFRLLAVDSAAKTVRVFDPDGSVYANLVAADQIFFWVYIHPDVIQFAIPAVNSHQGSRWPVRDSANVGVKTSGDKYQNWFFSYRGCAGLGSVTTVGVNGTVSNTTKTIAGAGLSYDGVNNRTTITWVETTSIMPITASTRNTTPLGVLTGAKAGSQYVIYSQTNTTTVVVGDLISDGVVAGDTAAPYIFNIDDALIVTAAGGAQYYYRHIATMASPVAFTLDAAFTADWTSVTSYGVVKAVNDMVVALNRGSEATSSNLYKSQISGNPINFLFAQNTQLQDFWARSGNTNPASAAFACKDCSLVDNIVGVLEFPDAAANVEAPALRGMYADKNALTGAVNEWGSTNTDVSQTIVFDSNLKPISGLTRTMGVSPVTNKPQIPFDTRGIVLTSSSLVGAIQP